MTARTARAERSARLGSSDVVLGVWLLGLAGFVDAIAFVVLQGSFVAFMSGNSTILGSSTATGHWGLVGLTALLVVLFFGGCFAGAAIVRWVGHAHRVVMVAIAVVILVGAIVATTASEWSGMVLIALAGGLISSALSAGTDVHVGLTYVTGTLVKAAHQLAAGIGTEHPWSWLSTVGYWFSFAVGAALGGLAFRGFGAQALWIAVGLAVVACVLPVRRETDAPDDAPVPAPDPEHR
ncbi:YoaK family protein [Gordonia sp. NB41Y]|uniref:YoaK family protein n=1 Tax=Gordonia sp. NB41Y TaxID=875808 RepID=UPI0013649B41|nr:YoaK family protein [Gordonia sp. NB41Y]WLP92701.1 YoaK family protein [Gordonia sp. NB41Y]